MARRGCQAEETLINDIVRTLERKLGKPTRVVERPLLPTVVKAILSVDAKPRKVENAFLRLEKGFVDWNEIRVTPSRDIAGYIKGVGDEEGKADALKALLSKVFADRHELDADFLADIRDETLVAYLETAPGLIPLYRQALLVGALSHSALLVSSGTLRVLKRVGVVPRHMDVDVASEVLSGVIAKRRMFAFSVLIARVASGWCTLRSPSCGDCPVDILCITAKTSSRPRKVKKRGGR